MSASLVGSEMCIRDSVSCAHDTRSLTKAPRAAPGEATMLTTTHATTTVSYTHLTLPTICSV
eukprot:7300971-Alexandrium_andersonii.AAC.1